MSNARHEYDKLVADRRTILTGLGALTVLAPLAPLPAFARGPATVAVDELMKPGELKEMTLGNPDAKVTIVEYASLTCPHCASFHKNIYPELKSKYIDTGKVLFVFRDYPLDERAEAGSMLAHCLGGQTGLAMVSELFKRQAEWAFVPGNVVEARLFDIAKQAGFTKASFEKCLTDQKLLDQITAVAKRASTTFGVNATPTFFVNGKRLDGRSMADFEKVIDPLLKG
ncbi:MAG: DsbA family protein [Hyphomicrobiaceae bacterium]